ncbi:hypothetical protein [Burkholderia pseudomallei]|uniref:hypothetical protein n=1 Tax=Burkholderia pseudomallei TaxID=28450 RepID=UPI0009B2EF99
MFIASSPSSGSLSDDSCLYFERRAVRNHERAMTNPSSARGAASAARADASMTKISCSHQRGAAAMP